MEHPLNGELPLNSSSFVTMQPLPEEYTIPLLPLPTRTVGPTVKSTVGPTRLRGFRSRPSTTVSPISTVQFASGRLHQAVLRQDIVSVLRLLRQGANCNGYDDKQRTPLHVAAAKANLDLVKVLVQNGARPNAKDFNGNTALHLACVSGNMAMIHFLLESGADPSLCDARGTTPISVAVSRLKRIFQRLNKKRSEIADDQLDGDSPLMAGISSDDDKFAALATKLDRLSPIFTHMQECIRLLGALRSCYFNKAFAQRVDCLGEKLGEISLGGWPKTESEDNSEVTAGAITAGRRPVSENQMNLLMTDVMKITLDAEIDCEKMFSSADSLSLEDNTKPSS